MTVPTNTGTKQGTTFNMDRLTALSHTSEGIIRLLTRKCQLDETTTIELLQENMDVWFKDQLIKAEKKDMKICLPFFLHECSKTGCQKKPEECYAAHVTVTFNSLMNEPLLNFQSMAPQVKRHKRTGTASNDDVGGDDAMETPQLGNEADERLKTDADQVGEEAEPAQEEEVMVRPENAVPNGAKTPQQRLREEHDRVSMSRPRPTPATRKVGTHFSSLLVKKMSVEVQRNLQEELNVPNPASAFNLRMSGFDAKAGRERIRRQEREEEENRLRLIKEIMMSAVATSKGKSTTALLMSTY